MEWGKDTGPAPNGWLDSVFCDMFSPSGLRQFITLLHLGKGCDMDMELVKQIEESIKLSNPDLENRAPGAVLEEVRKEKFALTFLLDMVSESISQILDQEEAVLGEILESMEGVDHRLEGPFVFQRQRGGTQIAYKEPLTTQGNIVDTQDLDLFPPEFIETKEVHVLRKEAFEEALKEGEVYPLACVVKKPDTLAVQTRQAGYRPTSSRGTHKNRASVKRDLH